MSLPWENNNLEQWQNIKLKFEHFERLHKLSPYYDLNDHDHILDFFFKNMPCLFKEIALTRKIPSE